MQGENSAREGRHRAGFIFGRHVAQFILPLLFSVLTEPRFRPGIRLHLVSCTTRGTRTTDKSPFCGSHLTEPHYCQGVRTQVLACGLFPGEQLPGVSGIPKNLILRDRLLDDELQNDLPSPYTTLSDHTLPITDIACGVGPFPSCRVLTSSVDHSVKVGLWSIYPRTSLSDPDGLLLRT